MISIPDLIKKIESCAPKQKTLLIAIDGRGGSGKSTLADVLQQKLSSVTIVHIDDFAYPDTDRQRLRVQVINPLKNNQQAKYQRYDWNTKALAEWHEIRPGGVVIIEGVRSLDEALYRDYDKRIWIECSAEKGFERGLQRDITVHKVDTKDKWINDWMPKEQAYIDSQNPQHRADYVIDGMKEIE